MPEENENSSTDLLLKIQKQDPQANWDDNGRKPIGLCSQIAILQQWGCWTISAQFERKNPGRLFITLGYEMAEETVLGDCLKGLKLYYLLKEKGVSLIDRNDGLTARQKNKFNWNLKLFIQYHETFTRDNWANYDAGTIAQWIIDQKQGILNQLGNLSDEIRSNEAKELSIDVKKDTAKWYLGNTGKYNNNMSDEELLNCYEKEVKAINKDTTAASLRENNSKTEQKKDMANDDMSQKEGYFTLKQIQEFFNRVKPKNDSIFSSNIMITGVTYDGVKLERAKPISEDESNRQSRRKKSSVEPIKYMTADIFFMLRNKSLVCNETELLKKINGKDKPHKKDADFSLGEGKTVKFRTNIGAGNLLSNLANTFVSKITNADPEKLKFSYVWRDGVVDLLMDWLDITHEKPSTSKGNDVSAPKHPRNCIWAGAPGTGKSFQLNQDASKDFKTGNIMRVTFHPEYTYYDFVGTYRPRMSKSEKGKIEYGFVPGPFAKMLKKALWNEETNYCLIIEEINRANAAAVFGDVFQLLDRASKNSGDGSVKKHESEYAICPSEELYEYLMDKQEGDKKMQGKRPSAGIMNDLRLPANLYIWATMNSADQGVFPMDTALKRRWSFVNMDIDPTPKADKNDLWDQLRRGINELLLEHQVQEDKLMGYYFLKEEERKNDLKNAVKEKVLLYLFEDAAKPFKTGIFQTKLNTCAKLREELDLEKKNLGIFQKDLWGYKQSQDADDTNKGNEGNDAAINL